MKNDQDFLMCRYVRPKRGSHPLVGVTVFGSRVYDNMRKTSGGWVINYGYHDQGDTFLVHKRDAEMQAGWFLPIETPVTQRSVRLPSNEVAPVQAPPPERIKNATVKPKPMSLEEELAALGVAVNASTTPTEHSDDENTEYDLQLLPGVSAKIATEMKAAGLNSKDSILDGGVDALTKISGIGESKANAIIAALQIVDEQTIDETETNEELEE